MKQTDFTDEFLQKYRELESAVERVMGKGYTVKDFEDAHPDVADQLRLLRQIRNYATHNTNIADILPIPWATVEYMDKMIACVLGPEKKVKEIMSRVKPLAMETPVQEAAKRLRSYPYLPVVDEEKRVCGIFTMKDLRDIVASGKAAANLQQSFKGTYTLDMAPMFVGPEDPSYEASLVLRADVPVRIVTSTGNMGGKYMGLFFEKK